MNKAKAIDPVQCAGKHNLSLLRLLEHIEQIHDPLFVESLQNQITEAIAKCETIRTWRNKRLAHSDLNTVLKCDAELLPGVSIDQVNDGAKSVQDVINMFIIHYFDTTP